jgi:hypothetical protein
MVFIATGTTRTRTTQQSTDILPEVAPEVASRRHRHLTARPVLRDVVTTIRVRRRAA